MIDKGFVLIDKPEGITTYDCIRAIKRIYKESGQNFPKIGHGGTLDPLATGLVIIALGSYTKLLTYLLHQEKTYDVVAFLGASSDTYDRDGTIETTADAKQATYDDITYALGNFMGEITQLPPKYSAIKIKGKPAYARARAGEDVVIAPRKVTILDITSIELTWPMLKFRVRVSGGTYIRSLVHDLGNILGCGGYVDGLRRVMVGEVSVQRAQSLKDLEEKKTITLFPEVYELFPHLTMYRVTSKEEAVLRQGGNIAGAFQLHKDYLVYGDNGPVAVGEAVSMRLLKPKVVV